MAPLKKVFLVYGIFFTLFILLFSSTQVQPLGNEFKITRKRLLLDTEFEDLPIVTKNKPNSFSTKNHTKLIKPFSNSTKNQTKLVKSATNLPQNQTKSIKLKSDSANNQIKSIKLKSDLAKNQTKSIKLKSDSLKNQTKSIKLKSDLGKIQTKLIKFASDSAISTVKNQTKLIKTQLKKLNSTSKPPNSTKPTSNPIKKLSDLTKLSTPKNKTTKTEPKPKNPENSQSTDKKPKSPIKPKTPNRVELEDGEDDLVSEFRDLPSRFQQTLLPDLEKISTTSKAYLSRYNKQITKGFKPYLGTKYAPTIASIVSFAFIIIPLILVSLLFNRIKAYFSLQKLIIFIQVYLSIYFSILCLSSLVTGLEPLRFFYATSQSTYVWLQILQTLGYVLYLLLLLMYLVLVFSTETGPGSKALGLAQTFVGFAVGLHYYVTVFHRVVLRQPPKTNWKVHGVYAACFLVICLLANADRRKKAYLEEGGEEGKKS